MPSVLPVQAICRGGSTRRIVEVIVPGPAFQRKTVPGATSPWIVIDFTSGFQLGQRSNAVRASQTASGEAAISISPVPTTGACWLIPVGDASKPRSDMKQDRMLESAWPSRLITRLSERLLYVS